MRNIVILATLVWLHSGSVFAQTPDDVKSDVLAALSTPMPITVVGPVITRDVTIMVEGDGFRATLAEPMLMGMIPMGSLSFKLTPAGDKLYHVTDFKLPNSLDVFNAFTVKLGTNSFDGLWSAKTRSYQNLNFTLNDVAVSPKGDKTSKVSLGSISLNVAKQGEAGATESRFAFGATDIQSTGFPPDDVKIESLTADLKASGPEPVDLYAVLARFAVIMSLHQNGDTALQFAESLRAKSYDAVTLNLSASGVTLDDKTEGATSHIVIDAVSGLALLTKITPDDWGSVSFKLNGKNITETGLLDLKEMTIGEGEFALSGSAIPIAATLNALSKMQSLQAGEPVKLTAAELIDGFFNIGAVSFKSSAAGVAYIPVKEDSPTVHIARYSFETGTEGLRDNKGRLYLTTDVQGLDIRQTKFATPLEEQTFHIFNPRTIRYDLSVSDLNEPLLRKLMADVSLNNANDYIALAAPAVAYVMASRPMVETKDLYLQSSELDVSSTSALRFYPAWVLGDLSYEGTAKTKIKGLDKLDTLIQSYIAEPDPAPVTADDGSVSTPPDKTWLVVMRSVVSTLKALSVADGDAQSWTVNYPKAGENRMIVNDIEMRFPNFFGYLGPMLMGTMWR